MCQSLGNSPPGLHSTLCLIRCFRVNVATALSTSPAVPETSSIPTSSVASSESRSLGILGVFFKHELTWGVASTMKITMLAGDGLVENINALGQAAGFNFLSSACPDFLHPIPVPLAPAVLPRRCSVAYVLEDAYVLAASFKRLETLGTSICHENLGGPKYRIQVLSKALHTCETVCPPKGSTNSHT